MERRAHERFHLDLPAFACPSEGPWSNEAARVSTRDISSAGAAFYCSGAWREGQRVFLDIQVGGSIVGPFSYTVRAMGRIVRKDFDPRHGTSLYAVSFENGARMRDWTEVEPRTRTEGGPAAGHGPAPGKETE